MSDHLKRMPSGITALELESICNQLNSNPAAATAALISIRDTSPNDTTLSLITLLVNCERSNLSANAIFQCINIVQYNIAKYWVNSSSDTSDNNSSIFSNNKDQIESNIWLIMQLFLNSNKYPPFLLNKLIQMYCLLWKLSWCDYNKEVIQSLFFAKVFALISNIDNATHIKTGTILLREVVEQFNNKSFVEINLPIEFHKKCHRHFEFFGLNESFQASFQIFTYNLGSISKLMTSQGCHSGDSNILGDKIQIFIENMKLFNEIVNWEFNENNNKLLKLNSCSNSNSSSDNTNEKPSIDVPITWIESIFTSNLIGNILNTYDSFSIFLSSSSNNNNNNNRENNNSILLIANALSEIRIFLLTISSISENSLKNESEKIFFVNFLLEKIVSVIDDNNQLILNNAVIMNDIIYSEKNGEIESFMNMLLKIFNNYSFQIIQKTPGYTNTITKLCIGTLARSNAINVFNKTNKSGTAALMSSYGYKNNNGFFFDTLNWNITTLFLTILQIVIQNNFNYESEYNFNSSVNNTNEMVKKSIQSASGQLFQVLFDNFLSTSISVAIAENIQDEDEEIEEIDMKIINEIIYLISQLGKIQIADTFAHISGIISVTIGECRGNLDNNSFIVLHNIRILETLRLCLLFATHVCDDTYYDEVANSSATACASTVRNYSCEEKLIPSIIIDYLLCNSNAHSSIDAVLMSFRNIAKSANYILEMQLFLIDNNRRSDLIFSPFLISSLMTFFRHYMQIFVDPNPSNYSQEVITKIGTYILSIHTTYNDSNSPSNDFNIIMSTIFNIIHKIIFYIPLEIETITSCGAFISACAKSVGSTRTSFLITLESTVSSVLEIVTNIADNRLNDIGIMNLYNCFCNFSIRINNYNMFMGLCKSVDTNMTLIAELIAGTGSTNSAHSDVYRLHYLKVLAALRGISACSVGAGEDSTIQDLFDSALPLLTSLTAGAYGASDDVLGSHLSLLRDYAEHQLNKLRKKSTNILYRASFSAVCMFRKRLKYSVATQGLSAAMSSSSNVNGDSSIRDGDESSFKNDLLLSMLELLNHLSTKDFLLDFDDVSPSTNSYSISSAGEETIEVPAVLLNGLQVIVPAIDVAMLRNYPKTCDRYFSFTAFICNTYSAELPSVIVSQAPSTISGDEYLFNFLNILIQHLLWSAGAIDSTAARLALQSIQALATHHVTTIRNNVSIHVNSSYGPFGQLVAARELFPLAMQRLLEMVIFPMSCEYGITLDRIDACANALLTLISTDVERFKHCVNSLIATPQYQQSLVTCFEKLTTANGVNILKIDKQNRLLFVKNMREFVASVRALVIVR